MMRVLLDLFAQPSHVHVDRSGRYPRCFPPHGVEQLIASKNTSAMIDEVFEKPKFADRGGDVLAAEEAGADEVVGVSGVESGAGSADG